MANNIIKRVWNQNRMVNIEDLTGAAFQAENGGHTFEISGIDDTGAAVALSGTVSGVFRRPDNADIALTGSASDSVVSVTLSEDCYAVPGRFGLTIFVTSNSQKVAVYACVGTVAVSSTGNVAGDTPANVEDLIDDINAAIADLNSAIGQIPASYANVMAAIAPTYSGSALYSVGSYAWYNGSLYRCTTAITTAEAWTAGHWTAVALGEDVSDLKSAISDISSGTKNIFNDELLVTTGITKSGHKISGTASAFNNAFGSIAIPLTCDASTNYTISFYAKNEGNSSTTGNGLVFRFVYSNDDYSSLAIPNSTITKTKFTAVSSNSKTVVGLEISFGSAGGNNWELNDIQIEKGTSATDFVPFYTAYDRQARYDIFNSGFITGDQCDAKIENAIEDFALIDGEFAGITPAIVSGSYVYYAGDAGSSSAGTVQSSNAKAYAKIEIGDVRYFEITTGCDRNTCICTFHNSETINHASFISGEYVSDGWASTKEVKNYIVRVPDNATYICVNSSNYSDYPIAVKKLTDEVYSSCLFDATLLYDKRYVTLAKEIHVAKDGSGDYSTIRAALDSIVDNDAEHRYNVIVHTGTYDVFDDYTQAEIEDDDFVGPMIKEGVSLIGYDGCGNVIINGELSTETYDNDRRNAISTLNMIGQYCRLEGITVKAKNIRYAVHDDLAPSYRPIYTRIYKDCVFIGETLNSGGSFGNVSFGAGTNGRKQMFFENCAFEDVVLIHTSNDNTQSSFTRMDSCKAKVCKIGDNNSTVPMYFNFNGCSFELLECYENSPTHNQFVRLDGTGGKIRFFDSDAQYVANLPDCVRYQDTEINAGYAVKVDNTLSPSISTARADIVGISVGHIDGDTFVQTDGYISTNVLGLSNVSIGDYVGIDENGKVVKINNDQGAVGVVKYAFGRHGNKFIKLTI